jgi:hypothetical protein
MLLLESLHAISSADGCLDDDCSCTILKADKIELCYSTKNSTTRFIKTLVPLELVLQEIWKGF